MFRRTTTHSIPLLMAMLCAAAHAEVPAACGRPPAAEQDAGAWCEAKAKVELWRPEGEEEKRARKTCLGRLKDEVSGFGDDLHRAFETQAFDGMSSAAISVCLATRDAIRTQRATRWDPAGEPTSRAKPFHRVGHFLFDDAAVELKGSYTDSSGNLGGPGLAADAVAEFDKEEAVGSVRVGWIGKPLLRDLLFALGGPDEIDHYRRVGKDGLVRWLFIDAVKADAWYRYGTKVNDQDGDDNFTTEEGPSFSVGLTYTVPLNRLLGLTPFKE